MRYNIVKIDTKTVTGSPTLLTKSQQENFQIITKQWKSFNYNLNSIERENGSNWEKFGLTIKKGNNNYYMPAIAFEGTNIMKKFIIPGGEYLKFCHIGSIKNLKYTIFKIYKDFLIKNDFVLDSNRELIHYERYDKRFNWNDHNSIIEIYVPISE